MAIIIKEYLGYKQFNGVNNTCNVNVKECVSDLNTIAEESIMVDIEGIHEFPFHTRNFTRYTKEALIGSVPTWTKPYLKPLIMHHNDKDGKIIGRIHNVEYTDKNTNSGTGALVFTVNVPDKNGKEQVLDGRLMTTSIGVLANDVRCSICGHNIAQEGECEHERGNVYDGNICYWDIHEMEGKELSYVIVPSDMYSKNKRIYKSNNTSLKESAKGVFDLTEEEKKLSNEESTIIDEEVPKDKGKDKQKNDKKKEDEEKKKNPVDELDKIKKELATTKQKLQQAIDDLEQEKQLKDRLEDKVIQSQRAARESLESEFTLLRKLSGKKELSNEELLERTSESLADGVKDLKEELTNDSTKHIKPVDNPALEKEKFNNTDIKEEKKEDDSILETDLSEELEKLFSGVIDSRNLKL